LVRRGLVSFEAVFRSHFCYVPRDSIVPGAMTMGDLCDVAGALAPVPLRMAERWMGAIVWWTRRNCSAHWGWRCGRMWGLRGD